MIGRAAAAALVCVLASATLACTSLQPRRKVRIGTNNSPVFNFIDENRRPAGFAVEVLNLAAERAGIELEWVITDHGPEGAFASGVADLWPVVTYVADRKKVMFLTEPWWRLATEMYVRKGAQINSISDLANRRVLLTSPSGRFLPQVRFPDSTQLSVATSPMEGLRRFCSGEADAVWLDHRAAHEALLNPPDECRSVALDSVTVPEATRGFSIGSRRGFESEARRLRDAVEDLVLDGHIVRLAARWDFVDPTNTALIAYLNATRRRNDLWRLSVVVLVVVLGASLLFLGLLRRAQRKAEASARARAQFLANMSHEVRTPMNAVIGMTDLALRTELTPEQREYLKLAHDSAERLLFILDDILDLSRIESGRVELERVPFSLRPVVDRSVLMLSLQASEKGISLTTRFADDVPPFVLGDPSRVQQILINLLGNAVKFTDTGSVRVEVTRDTNPTRSSEIVISVADTGLGIAEEHRKSIFEAFTQADASTTRRYGGTGLGLAITAQLVQLMNGTISVDGEPGVGSTFTVRLPMEAAEEPAGADEIPSPVPARPLSILVVEDNLVNRTLAERVLARAGHKVHSVDNGLKAVEAVANGHDVDVILMDVHMPVMDGIEATKQIRQREALNGRRVPIVALTALAVRGDAERCLSAGMDSYLAKPFRAEELLAAVARAAD